MNHHTRNLVFATTALFIAASLGFSHAPSLHATPADSPHGAAEMIARKPDDTNPWTVRLEALSPSKPMDYFLLAEDVAGDREDAGTFILARRLYAC